MHVLSGPEAIERLYAERGAAAYGEGVTQTEHALQCASLAQHEGAPASLVIAALLHDIGHLFAADDATARARCDDRHEAIGAQVLKGLFPESVWRLVGLHVAAKRWLCFAESGYWVGLSDASKASLTLQGGPFAAGQAETFERAARWREAVALRRFDDAGKQQEPCGRTFAEFMPLMRSLLNDRS